MTTDKIYRYKIKTDELYNSMIEFSKSNRHKSDDEIKKEFLNWINSDEISNLVKKEENKLKEYDYDLINNPIESKIYKRLIKLGHSVSGNGEATKYGNKVALAGHGNDSM